MSWRFRLGTERRAEKLVTSIDLGLGRSYGSQKNIFYLLAGPNIDFSSEYADENVFSAKIRSGLLKYWKDFSVISEISHQFPISGDDYQYSEILLSPGYSITKDWQMRLKFAGRFLDSDFQPEASLSSEFYF